MKFEHEVTARMEVSLTVDSTEEIVIETSWHVLRFRSKELVSVFAGT